MAIDGEVFVLMKERESQEPLPTPHAVCVDEEGVQAVMRSIDANNRKYELRETGELRWEIGPEEDEGFFGDKKMRFWAVRTKVRS